MTLIKPAFVQKTILAYLLLCGSAVSQAIMLRAVDGKSGKPLVHQRLLVFAGSDADGVRFHKHSYDLRTNEDGLAVLAIGDPAIKRIQVWVDFQHLCQSTPNFRSFDISEVAAKGLSTPNDCSSIHLEPKPGVLTIFARSRTRREISEQ